VDSEWQGLLLGKAYDTEEEIEDESEPTLRELETSMKKEMQATWEELKKVIREEVRREMKAGFREMSASLYEKLGLPPDIVIEAANNTIVKKKQTPRHMV
jgi:molybdopterin converting factor small subunit